MVRIVLLRHFLLRSVALTTYLPTYLLTSTLEIFLLVEDSTLNSLAYLQPSHQELQLYLSKIFSLGREVTFFHLQSKSKLEVLLEVIHTMSEPIRNKKLVDLAAP